MEQFDALLRDAQSTSTKSDRLWEIKESDLTGLTSPEIHSLVSALADHPNADEDLCKELLREWPKETLASTRFRLMLLADNQIDWSEIFDEFHDALPALTSLVDIPSSYNTIVRLFEAELLSRLDGLSCSFDWNITCSHEISIDWQPVEDQDEEIDDEDDPAEECQDFTITLSATIDSGNCAILRSPGTLDDTKLLFAELNALKGADQLLQILQRHGWDCEVDTTGDGGYFDLESVEPELDEWVFSSASIMGNGSGTLCVTDPSGEEHEIELPEGEMEDSFVNYVLEEGFDLSVLFDHDMDALDAFERIVR
jgi:hypothetical protein